MSGIASELEQELEFELEQELEQEGETEQEELEFELEQNWGWPMSWSSSTSMRPSMRPFSITLRRWRIAAGGHRRCGALPWPPRARRSKEQPGLSRRRMEGELEGEYELELEFNPARRAHLNAMLEHMGHAAADAATEQEAAEHFLPLIPLVAKFALPLLGKALPFAAKAAAKLAPKILGKVVPNPTRGVANIARTLFRNRSTRPLLHAIPRIARGTTTHLGRRVARGGRVPPVLAARRSLAKPPARSPTRGRSPNLPPLHGAGSPLPSTDAAAAGRPSVRPGGAAGGTSPGSGGFASPSDGAPMPGAPVPGRLPLPVSNGGAAPIPALRPCRQLLPRHSFAQPAVVKFEAGDDFRLQPMKPAAIRLSGQCARQRRAKSGGRPAPARRCSSLGCGRKR